MITTDAIQKDKHVKAFYEKLLEKGEKFFKIGNYSA